jgi:hypothetical protein
VLPLAFHVSHNGILVLSYDRRVVVLWSQLLFTDGQVALVERLGLSILGAAVKIVGHSIEEVGYFGTFKGMCFKECRTHSGMSKLCRTDVLCGTCSAGYRGHPYKKSERSVLKLSASLLALPSQRVACAKN